MLANHSRNRRVERRMAVLLLVALIVLGPSSIACRKARVLAPVSGKVTWHGKPLPFGAVIFQPESGQPAVGEIQPDGSFQVTTRGEGAGAAIGLNQVRIACYEGQESAGPATASEGERPLGRSLIPAKYLSYQTSGLIVDVRPDANGPLLLELTD